MKKSSFLLAITIAIVLMASVWYIFFSYPFSEEIYQRKRFLMGTLVTISVVSKSQDKGMSAINRAFSVMENLEKQASKKIPGSYTSLINEKAGTGSVSVSLPFLEMVQKSVEYFTLTEGAFDITIGPVSGLWHFEDGQGEIPDPNSIREKLPLVNSDLIQIDLSLHQIGLKRAGASIDPGGVAKGWIVDQAVNVLKTEGITAGIVNAGGNISLFGYKPGQDRYWHIGIQHPRKEDEILTSIKLTDKSIATSGDYERYVIKDNIRYHHILNPKTGWSVSECQSVTIIAGTALDADALSTSVFVLGPAKGMALIEKLPDVEGLIVDSQGKITASSGFKSEIKIGRH